MKTAVILSGGTGSRFNAAIPKQFITLSGKPVLFHSLLTAASVCDKIAVVSLENHISETESLVHKILQNHPSLHCQDISVIPGGQSRQESVFEGLDFFREISPELIAVHDGVRPLASDELYRKGFEKLQTALCAVPIIPSTSTLAVIENNCISQYTDRSKIYQIQTPQFFRYPLLLSAHLHTDHQYTDDSQIIYHYFNQFPSEFPEKNLTSKYRDFSKTVDILDGEDNNIKITTPSDLTAAEAILRK